MADQRYEPEGVHVVWIVRILLAIIGMLVVALGVSVVLMRLYASNIPAIESFAAFCQSLVAQGDPVLQTDPSADLEDALAKQRAVLEGKASEPASAPIGAAMTQLVADGYRLDPQPKPQDQPGGPLP